MNRVKLRSGAVAAVAAFSVLSPSASSATGAPIGKNGVIHSCFKVKGKNRGALRVVPGANRCRKLRGGWRPLSWSANSSPGTSGQSGAQGSHGDGAQEGPQGNPGPEGKQGQQGIGGQVEKSLIDTVKTQTTEIDGLASQVTDLTDEVLGLEGELTDLSGGLTNLEGNVTGLGGDLLDIEDTVGETCAQLETVTEQSDKLRSSLLGSSVAVLGNLLNVPSPPSALGTFECG